MIKILLAEDEDNIREVVELYLQKEGFSVFTAADGECALELEAHYRPDLLILDVMLPKLSGWEVCRRLSRSVPVLFLTAKGSETDKMTGFALGADDYITKPFSPRELVARVKAVLRRSGLLPEAGEMISLPGLTIAPLLQTVTCGDQQVQLSPKEFELLLFLIRHPRTVFSREQLLNNIWGYDYDGDDRTVDATIKRLRHKIASSEYQYIHTVWGVGYKFEVPAK